MSVLPVISVSAKRWRCTSRARMAGGLAQPVVRQRVVVDPRHFDVDVGAV